MRSIKARLIKVLFIIAVLCWAVVLGIWIAHSMREESGHHDVLFQTTAGQILLSMPMDVEQIAGTPRAVPGDEAAHRPEKLSFQVWVNRTRPVIRSPAAPLTPLKPDFNDGFANQLHGSDMWRVYSIGDVAGRLHVQVGAIHSIIDDEIRGKVGKALVAASVLLLLLGTAIWWVICWSIRPVEEIEAALKKKDVFDLTPLPANDLPAELKP
ncbi:MAG: two-component sensor histidine kinase, partial [Betaproteobacteria bacterium]|nr:two-component sensor histidine kinase [Betaproteobacteria bacterium]